MLTILLFSALPAQAQWGETAAEKSALFGEVSGHVATHWIELLGDQPSERCRITYYHPREAGGAWRRWANCRALGGRDLIPGPGGKVRPGVACVQARRWRTWQGKLLAIEGQGLVQVLDADVHRADSRPIWFDLAVPGPPWQYADWLADGDRVHRARSWSGHSNFFEVSPEQVVNWIGLCKRQPPMPPSSLPDQLTTSLPANG